MKKAFDKLMARLDDARRYMNVSPIQFPDPGP